ncbi:MAG: LacI family DNA-binding transcriptional regulator [Chloroflexota bacterium]
MKRPTQVDVARLAGVSRATVSYVINGQTKGSVNISSETEQRVQDAIAQLGYEPDARAQALRSGNTNTIGIVIPDTRNPHYWECAEGIEQEAANSGYHILLSSTAASNKYAEDIFKDLSRRRIDGLIIMGAFTSESAKTKNTVLRLIKRGMPIVEMSDNFHEEYNVDIISSDYRAATTEAMSHLFSLSHKRIGLIYGVSLPKWGEDRLLPYQDSLRSAGLPVDKELIVHCGPTIEDGYAAARQMLEHNSRPTAMIAINDLLAIGALRAANDLQLNVPTDLSLIGFDDIHMAKYLVPRLTTVTKSTTKGGQEALKLLLSRIQEPDRPYQKIDFPAQLIIRESTGPAPTTNGNK